MSAAAPKTFADYARRFPRNVRERLQSIRQTIRAAAPDATETISYKMPAFRLTRILAWYGAHDRHIGFYPGAAAIAAFKNDLARYKSAKGSVQFPHDEPLPLDVIRRIVKFRIDEQSRR